MNKMAPCHKPAIHPNVGQILTKFAENLGELMRVSIHYCVNFRSRGHRGKQRQFSGAINSMQKKRTQRDGIKRVPVKSRFISYISKGFFFF